MKKLSKYDKKKLEVHKRYDAEGHWSFVNFFVGEN